MYQFFSLILKLSEHTQPSTHPENERRESNTALMPSFEDKYVLGEELGKGAYAIVYRCTSKERGDAWAVKVIDKTKAGPKDISDVLHEVNMMKEVGHHPNVVRLYALTHSPTHSLTHPPTHSLTHSLIHSFTHLSTHSLTFNPVCFTTSNTTLALTHLLTH